MALYGTIVGCFGCGLFPRFVTLLVLENSSMMYQNGVLSCSLSETGFQGSLSQCFLPFFILMLTHGPFDSHVMALKASNRGEFL